MTWDRDIPCLQLLSWRTLPVAMAVGVRKLLSFNQKFLKLSKGRVSRVPQQLRTPPHSLLEGHHQGNPEGGRVSPVMLRQVSVPGVPYHVFLHFSIDEEVVPHLKIWCFQSGGEMIRSDPLRHTMLTPELPVTPIKSIMFPSMYNYSSVQTCL